MNRDQSDRYLLAVDDVLVPLGFKRKSRSREWSCATGTNDRKWIHINFGLSVINPSLGVTYEDLAGLVPSGANPVQGVACMLTSLSGQMYSEATNPALLAQHVVAFALPRLDTLADRNEVIRALQSSTPKDWPVLGVSARIRLLPLMLEAQGRKEEAIAYLSQFEREAEMVDQELPRFSDFARGFRSKHAV